MDCIGATGSCSFAIHSIGTTLWPGNTVVVIGPGCKSPSSNKPTPRTSNALLRTLLALPSAQRAGLVRQAPHQGPSTSSLPHRGVLRHQATSASKLGTRATLRPAAGSPRALWCTPAPLHTRHTQSPAAGARQGQHKLSRGHGPHNANQMRSVPTVATSH